MTTYIVSKDQSFAIPDRLQAEDGRYYSIEDKLGAGGNGVVHQCTSEADGEVFAIKFLTSVRDETRTARFALEKNVMSALSAEGHDHLIHFIAEGSTSAISAEGRGRKRERHLPYVIMEKADMSLRDLVRKSRSPISSAIYMAQFRGLVSALEILHKHAIHRDIKPENILVIGDRWVISDFGLCSAVEKDDDAIDLTRHWEIIGPRFWMSPEANNRSVGVRDEISFASDIFQLAAVFWWVVNRRHPSGILTRDDWSGIEHLYEPISKALQHSLGRRFASATEFRTAVVEAIEA